MSGFTAGLFSHSPNDAMGKMTLAEAGRYQAVKQSYLSLHHKLQGCSTWHLTFSF